MDFELHFHIFKILMLLCNIYNNIQNFTAIHVKEV